MKDPNHIYGPLLCELVTRWSPNDESFTIREYFVPLLGLDTFMGLGLGISGEVVRFEDDNKSLVRNLFNGNDITITGIVEKLIEKKILKKM